MRRVLFVALLLTLAGPLSAQGDLKLPDRDSSVAQRAPGGDLKLPNKGGSVKFAILGDTGTGGSDQKRVANMLAAYRPKFEFDFAVLLGDNLYGSENPRDYERKFAIPYKALLDAGVKFYAALGNHDDPNQRLYKPFNMNGERYYTFKPSLTSNVRFFVLDTNYMNPQQVQWLQKELAASGSDWKIAMFHHPLYASGMHGSDEVLKQQLEPIFVKHKVNVVLQGHEHFYERIKPQKGVQYFVVGASAKLRRGDINPTGLTAFGFDNGYSFMLAEIVGDEMYFQVVTEKGQTVDSGVIRKDEQTDRVVATSGTSGTPKPQPQQKPQPAPARK